MKVLSKQRQERGFSLAELLVAMFVIVVGIAGVTSALFWGLQKTDSGKFHTQASNLCRVFTESYLARGLTTLSLGASTWPPATSGVNDGPNERKPLFSPPFNDLADFTIDYDSNLTTAELEKFTRNVSVTRLAAPGSVEGPNGTGYKASLARLVVRVYWHEKSLERHAELETVFSHGVEP